MTRRNRLLVLAGTLLVLAIAATAALRLAQSERGAALVVGALQRALPQLAIEGRSGTLLEARISRLRWRGEREVVTLQDLAWRLDAGCLAKFALCVDSFSAQSLDITLGAATDHGEFDLQRIELPLDPDIAQGSLGSLRIVREGQELLRIDEIVFRAAVTGSHIEVERLAGRIGETGIRLSGRLDLEGKLPLSANATLAQPDWPALRLRAQGDLARLEVHAEAGGPWPFTASGTVDPLGEALPFALQLQASAPLSLPGELADYGTLDNTSATLAGSLERVEATFEASTVSTWIGGNRLRGAATWSPAEGLALTSAALEGAIGTVQGSGHLALSGDRNWQLAAELHEACLPRWRTQTGCGIGGSVRLDGALRGTREGLRAMLDVQGKFDARPLSATGTIALDGAGGLIVDGLELAGGGNRLRLTGSAGERLDLEGELQAQDLAQTLAQASGHGHGEFQLRGTRGSPELEATLQLQQAGWQGSTAQSLEAAVRWRGPQASGNRLSLDAQGLVLAGLPIDGLNALLAGSTASHRLSAQTTGEGLKLALDCSGTLAARSGDWSGRCRDLELQRHTGAKSWRLDETLAIAWNAARRSLALEPFCLRNANASICNTQRLSLAPAALDGIALRLRALPLDLISPWLPEELQAQGTLDLAVDASRRGNAPLRLSAKLESAVLQIVPLAAGEELPFDLRELAIGLEMEQGVARLQGQARSGATGVLSGALEIAGTAPGSALSGSVTLAAIDTGPMLRIIPGSLEARGRLDGRIGISGTVASPQLAGELDITEGLFAHESLTHPIDEFALVLTFVGPQASLKGHLRTQAGTGNIDGNFRWAGEDWSARLHLHAEELLLEPRRGLRIHVVPDITLDLEPALASVSGSVRIPTADIDLESLPESAVSVSRDTVIVGKKTPESRFDYALAINLELGKAVHLKGFGADARLGGGIRLQRQPGTPLEGRGEVKVLDGRYTAYGQRLEVTAGSLLFRGPLGRPGLRITAVRRIEDEQISVGVQVRGDAKAPEVTVFSKPTMPESRALHYLLTGRAPATGDNNELALSSTAMRMGLAGAGVMTGRVLGKLGIQDFQIDSRDVQGGTEVQLSGYITPDLYLRYGVSTFEKVNTFRLRYRLTPRFFVEAVSGVENAVDFLYSFHR